MILTFHGLPRSGKDTAADHLVEQFGMVKDSFGRSIYDEAAPAFGVSTEQMLSHEWKTEPQSELALIHCLDGEFIRLILHAEMLEAGHVIGGPDYLAISHDRMLLPRSSRFILQRWATEYRRARDPLYWVRTLAARMAAQVKAQPGTEFVIADLREDHEAAYLLAFAGQHGKKLRVIEILRHGTVKSDHASDAGLPWRYINTRITNAEGEQDAFLWTIRRTYMNVKGIK